MNELMDEWIEFWSSGVDKLGAMKQMWQNV
jgi:hypothetical protein